MPAHPYLWTTCVTVRWLRDTRSLAHTHAHAHASRPYKSFSDIFPLNSTFPTINLGEQTSKPLRSCASGRVWTCQGGIARAQHLTSSADSSGQLLVHLGIYGHLGDAHSQARSISFVFLVWWGWLFWEQEASIWKMAVSKKTRDSAGQTGLLVLHATFTSYSFFLLLLLCEQLCACFSMWEENQKWISLCRHCLNNLCDKFLLSVSCWFFF